VTQAGETSDTADAGLPGRDPPARRKGTAVLQAFWIAFGVIFVAELGDKSQLLALALACQFRAWPVLAGISIASAVVYGLSVALGVVVAGQLPTSAISIIAGIAFLGFAAWTLRGDRRAGDEAELAARAEGEAALAKHSGRSAVLTSAITVFLAELGDKTMLATITLAARGEAFGTWLGSVVGMVAADAIAVGVGSQLGARLPRRVVLRVAALLFVAFGVLLIYQGFAD